MRFIVIQPVPSFKLDFLDAAAVAVVVVVVVFDAEAVVGASSRSPFSLSLRADGFLNLTIKNISLTANFTRQSCKQVHQIVKQLCFNHW